MKNFKLSRILWISAGFSGFEQDFRDLFDYRDEFPPELFTVSDLTGMRETLVNSSDTRNSTVIHTVYAWKNGGRSIEVE